MLGISCLGIIFRVMRILSPSFSKMLLLRKVHGSQLNGIIMSSGECFVLELIIDNLSNTPMFIDSVITEVAANMKEMSYRRSTKDSYRNFVFNYHDDVEASAPLLQEERDYNLESTKLSPILPQSKSQFETHHVKSNEQVFSHDNGDEDKVRTLTPEEEDTLIDLQEVAKPTSKKKKNKKNQRVAISDSEDGNKKSKVEEAGGSIVVNADSTVVSFLEDSHLSQEWL